MSAHDLRLADEDARRAARTIFDRPLVLEAGAGTGKTSALVARVLAWSLGPGWERSASALGERGAPSAAEIAARTFERIVAITFTEAAAAEMAERIGIALERVLHGASPHGLPLEELALPEDVLSLRARALLGALDHLVVRTIHAWCRRLLARHPLEAGLPPDFEVDSDGEARAQAARDALQSGLRALCADPVTRASLCAIACLDLGVDAIEAELLRLLEAGVPADALAAPLLAGDDARRVADAVREHAARVLAIVGERFLTLPKNAKHPPQAIEEVRALVERMPRDPDPLDDLMQVRAWVRGAESVANRMKEWSAGTLQKGEANALGDDGFALLDAARELGRAQDAALALDPALLEHGRRLLEPLLRDAQERARESGFVSFDALLRLTRRLLDTNGEVAADLRSGIDLLLVDEFQDTDHVQCAIVHRIALEGPPTARPSLFLVGDPKQSIYGWRQADLAAYDAFVARVVEGGGALARLSRNFRSVPEILDDVERVIRPVMREEHGVQPRFEPLVAHHGSRESGPAVEYWVSWTPDARERTPARDAARLEARAIADDMVRLHAEANLPWHEMAILLRGMSDVEIYLDALRARDVPYQVARDRSYFRRREIVDAAALVRAIVDPGDDLALVAWLRSPTVGVPDAAWLPLWMRGFPERVEHLDATQHDAMRALVLDAAGAQDGLEAEIPSLARVRGWPLALGAALEDLVALRASFRSDPPDVFVEHLRARTRIEIAAARRFLGAFRLANLERFWFELIEALDAERADPQALVRRLRRAVADAEDAEEARPDAFAMDAVQVMTMHGAKGLDFEAVYLPQLHKETRARDASVPIREYRGALTLSLFGAMTPAAIDERARMQRVAAAERVRLLYVAMTRAKGRLVLCGNFASARDRDTMARLLRERSPDLPELEPLLHELRAAGLDHVDVDDVRVAFPGLRFADDDADLQRAPSSPGIDAAAAIDAARRLDTKRQAASARMTRAFGGAVSDLAHERVREALADQEDAIDDGALARGASSAPEPHHIALAVGSTVHRVLESIALEGDVPRALREADIDAAIPEPLDEAIRDDVRERAATLVEALANGPLAIQLAEIAPRVLAREWPVLMSPHDAGSDALGYVAGTIDLVYRDDDGRLVVADYKTDLVDDDGLEVRVAAYALQLQPYARALESALALERAPRTELWFVARGEIRRVSE